MWKLNIYYRHQLVKTIKVNKEELEPVYKCKVWFKKHIFATICASVIFQPVAYLYIDKEKKEMSIEAALYEGVRI